MANNSTSPPASNDNHKAYNWLLLIELLICGLLATFIFHYLDRVFGRIVGYIIRYFTWLKWGAYVDIGSLQISLLAGRIFFKSVRYHGHNVTVLVHSGHITWHYWYPRTRLPGVLDTNSKPLNEKHSTGDSRSDTHTGHEEKGESKTSTSRFPCRIKVHVEGVEGFFYNRSPAYDNIVSHFDRVFSTKSETHRKADSPAKTTLVTQNPHLFSKELQTQPSSNDSKTDSLKDEGKPELPFWIRIFPIFVNCKTGALILGNENTKTIITTRFTTATGTFDAGESSGPLDVFKYLFGFEIKEVKIDLRPNTHYKEPQLVSGARAKSSTHETKLERRMKRSFLHRPRIPFFKSGSSVKSSSSVADHTDPIMADLPSDLPGAERWQGLSRYMDASYMNEHDEWAGVEYAASSVLADCPQIGFTFYWDSPGMVPHHKKPESYNPADHINGAKAPEYGMEILIYGGTVNYGPWTDRQRIIFQNIFFPPLFAGSVTGIALKPGAYRVSSEFQLYLSIEEDTTLRIPIREPSKDWRWKGRGDVLSGGRTDPSIPARGGGTKKMFRKSRTAATTPSSARPPAWLDVKAPKNTTVHYTSDMIARHSGFKSTVTAEVPSLEITTSVNHGLLWRSGPTIVDCDLSVPLQFNSLREWHFGIQNDDLELFILRDHLYLLVDVVSDWTTGPPADFYTFTPFKYNLDVEFRNFKLFLNTNDSNIINSPADFDDNNYLTLYGDGLKATVMIPLDELNPVRKEIPFNVSGENFGLQLCLNPRNTVSTFTGPKDIVTVETVTLKGSHVANSQSSTQLTDRLTFFIDGSTVTVWAFGFIIHHLVNLKENYFGEYLHFKTLEEYQTASRRDTANSLGITEHVKAQESNRSTDLDVILCISVNDTRVLLPTNLYKAEDCISLTLPLAGVDLRITNYYMDLQVDLNPISLSLRDVRAMKDSAISSDDKTELFVQSANVSMHRVFGLPPTEPSYMSQCSVNVGDVTGECSEKFLEKLLRAVQSLAVSATDDENAVSLIPLAKIDDVIFLRATTQHINIWFHISHEALGIKVEPSTVEFNDWAKVSFSQRLKAVVPQLSIAIAQKMSISQHRKGSFDAISTSALIQTSLTIDLMQRKLNFSDERKKQQDFIALHDARTNRAPFLVTQEANYSRTSHELPAMGVPPIPIPIMITSDASTFSSLSVSSASSSAKHTGKRRLPQRLNAKDSRGSLAHSVKRTISHASLIRTSNNTITPRQSPDGYFRHSSRTVFPKLQSSSGVFSSSLTTPYFPLMYVRLDERDLPRPAHRSAGPTPQGDSDSQLIELPEDAIHTSILINLGSGIRGFVKPSAISSIIDLISLLPPKSPEDLLDVYQSFILKSVLSNKRNRERLPESLEIRLDIASVALRFLNPFQLDSPNVSQGVDQFDLSITGLALIARQQLKSPACPDGKLTLHTAFKTLALTATERYPEHATSDVAFSLTAADFLIWLVLAEKDSGNVSCQIIEVEAASSQMEYLSNMIERTTRMVDGIVVEIDAIIQQFNDRLRYLAYSLTLASKDVIDPPFLTRPSYLIRTSANHVRNNESWKIISRFRQIYEKASPEVRQQLAQDCQASGIKSPKDAVDTITQSWNKWRPWDIADIRETTAFHILYPRKFSAAEELIKSGKAIEAALRFGRIHFVLDRGPNSSEFEANLLSVDINSSGPKNPAGLMLVDSIPSTRKSTLLVDCQEVVLGLNWELLGLAESLVPMIDKLGNSAKSTEEPAHVSSRPQTAGQWAHEIQSIIKVQSTVVKLTTINLQSTLANEDMSISLIGNLGSSASDSQLISALLHSQEAWCEFSSKSVSLLKMKALAPNLYLSRQVPNDDVLRSSEVEWRLAGMSSHLSIDLDEEILDMLEIADRVVRDEVAEFKQRLGGILDQVQERPKPQTKMLRGLPKLNLALIMDGYSINVALLQSIAYTMQGKQGRISITPKFVQPRALDINFDIEGHQHSLISTYPGEEHVISSFNLPPVNGQIAVRRLGERISINVTSIIEEIVVDAKQVYGLLTTFKRPEMANTFRSIQSDIKSIQDRLETIFPASAVASSVEELKKSTFVYNVHATLSGMKITTTTKLQSLSESEATLSIGLDCVQLRAYNVMEDDGEILPLPEISAKLRRIYAELNIRDASGIRPCGKLSLLALIRITRRASSTGVKRNYKMELKAIEVHAFAETASAVVNILNELQGKIKDLDLSRERNYLQRLRQPIRRASIMMADSMQSDFTGAAASGLFTSAFSISLTDIQICWIVGNSVAPINNHNPQDLVLSIKIIDLRSKSRSMSRLTIEDLLLQMVPPLQSRRKRSLNSALLPEMVFDVKYASNEEDRRISFIARGKGLDVQLESQFILPASMVQRSISLAVDKFQEAAAAWGPVTAGADGDRRNPFSDKRVSSLLIDADFAGAVIQLSSRFDPGGPAAARLKASTRGDDKPQGRFGQFANSGNSAAATFRTPGLAFRVEYNDTGKDSAFTSEIKINSSSNALTPSVVPLVLDISNSVKLIVEDTDNNPTKQNKLSQSFFSDERLLNADPGALLGSTSFNLGIRICKQEFSLSCQPIARVDATLGVDDIYITANSIKSADKDLFFAVGATFENLQAAVQHVYSRGSTFSFNMERLVLSAMNSKHLSGTAGISAVIKVYPMKTHVNARQLQDFLLFRDIWLPEEIRRSTARTQNTGSQEFLVQKYQQVANATAFPWTVTLAIERVEIDLDMGQAIGRASLIIDDLWANSKKDSNWEQNLCIGLKRMAVESTGRTSGFVELGDFQVRLSISWPLDEGSAHQTPLIQASAAFERLRVKAAFDYQVFAIIDIATFTFLMYNVREAGPALRDRLVASLDGDRVQVSCTANSAALAIALFQAIEKLVQENQFAYSQSIKEIERFLKRDSMTTRPRLDANASFSSSIKDPGEKEVDAPISLHTDVVVSLREINLGAFPGTFSDNTVFLVNALDIQARFAVKMNHENLIHSALGMTLGQLQVALTQTSHPNAPKTSDEITVDEVIQTMRSARGGVILRVPKVVAKMQTWQAPMTNHIDYTFRSSFEGKVDVGWNLARIAFIRDMWNTHTQSLATRLGKPLPKSAVHIRAVPDIEQAKSTAEGSTPSLSITDQKAEDGSKTERITAVVNVPQSKYDYRPLETAIIDTPQLRDMGEATPPLEWIGLHRDRLPNVTHQIVIVGLLGVAREVEDAYERILGRSGIS